MSLYFITVVNSPDKDPRSIKIGISAQINKRIRALQTGNSCQLKLMGYIESDNDRYLEKKLHQKYSNNREKGEWFCLSASTVLDELRFYASNSYISVANNAFEICSHDSDGVPEFIGAWEWGDIDCQDFCPQCGWGGGLCYNQASDAESCLKCGFPIF